MRIINSLNALHGEKEETNFLHEWLFGKITKFVLKEEFSGRNKKKRTDSLSMDSKYNLIRSEVSLVVVFFWSHLLFAACQERFNPRCQFKTPPKASEHQTIRQIQTMRPTSTIICWLLHGSVSAAFSSIIGARSGSQ